MGISKQLSQGKFFKSTGLASGQFMKSFPHFTDPFKNEGTAWNVWELRPGNCNDAEPRCNSDHQIAKAKVNSDFQNIVNKDLDPLKENLKAEIQANSITVQ